MSHPTDNEMISSGFGRAPLARVCYARESRDDAGPVRKPRILIVEDDYFVGMANEETLVTAGYDVIAVVTNGEDAVAVATQERPELVVMDIRLTGSSDGIFAATQLFQRLGIRAIFATAHADPATQSRAAAARPLGWLSKPFSGPTLVRAVSDALRAKDEEQTSR